MTEPLGPVNADPSILNGRAAQTVYAEGLDAIRADLGLSDLARATQIEAAHRNHVEELARLRSDLDDRRRARLSHIQAQLPNGPNIPANVSAADRAVLVTAFRGELARARDADQAGRLAQLADGLRYGDDAAVRAVMTVAFDTTDMPVINAWAEATGNDALIAEHIALHGQYTGSDRTAVAFAEQAFRQPSKPRELADLHHLRQAAERAAQDAAQTARRNVHVY